MPSQRFLQSLVQSNAWNLFYTFFFFFYLSFFNLHDKIIVFKLMILLFFIYIYKKTDNNFISVYNADITYKGMCGLYILGISINFTGGSLLKRSQDEKKKDPGNQAGFQ